MTPLKSRTSWSLRRQPPRSPVLRPDQLAGLDPHFPASLRDYSLAMTFDVRRHINRDYSLLPGRGHILYDDVHYVFKRTS